MSFRENLSSSSSLAATKDKRDRGLPNRLRRQPRAEGRRFSFPVTAALDAETFGAVNAASLQGGVTRSLVVAQVLRDWATRTANRA